MILRPKRARGTKQEKRRMEKRNAGGTERRVNTVFPKMDTRHGEIRTSARSATRRDVIAATSSANLGSFERSLLLFSASLGCGDTERNVAAVVAVIGGVVDFVGASRALVGGKRVRVTSECAMMTYTILATIGPSRGEDMGEVGGDEEGGAVTIAVLQFGEFT